MGSPKSQSRARRQTSGDRRVGGESGSVPAAFCLDDCPGKKPRVEEAKVTALRISSPGAVALPNRCRMRCRQSRPAPMQRHFFERRRFGDAAGEAPIVGLVPSYHKNVVESRSNPCQRPGDFLPRHARRERRVILVTPIR